MKQSDLQEIFNVEIYRELNRENKVLKSFNEKF